MLAIQARPGKNIRYIYYWYNSKTATIYLTMDDFCIYLHISIEVFVIVKIFHSIHVWKFVLNLGGRGNYILLHRI